MLGVRQTAHHRRQRAVLGVIIRVFVKWDAIMSAAVRLGNEFHLYVSITSIYHYDVLQIRNALRLGHACGPRRAEVLNMA